jgi:Zn-dependent protease
MRHSMPAFSLSLFGIPVRLRLEFFLVSAIFGWRDRSDGNPLVYLGIWMAIVTVSIFVHELGHALAMRRFGFPPSIELYGGGGLTRWPEGVAPTPKQNIVVSAAGPFAGFVLGAAVGVVAFALGSRVSGIGSWTLTQLLWVNVGWGILNLLPMLPWDGGHVLRGILDLATGGKGLKPAAIVAIVLGVICVPLAIWSGLYLGAYFAVVSVGTGIRLLRQKPSNLTLDSLTYALESAGAPKLVWEALAPLVPAGARTPFPPESIELYRKTARDAEQLASMQKSPDDAARAREGGAWYALLANDVRLAEELTLAIERTHQPSPLLSAVIAARRGHFDEALSAVTEIDESVDAAALIEVAIFIARREPDKIVELVRGATELKRHTLLLADTVLFYAPYYEQAATVAEIAFTRHASPDDAYNAACSLCRMHKLQESLQWLERAIEAGYAKAKQLDEDEDLAEVRTLPEYAAVRAKLVREKTETAA